MLTFFRRIRKGLLGEGTTSKYLLYAIGEIALVVIGILIALQINNWNENRKMESLEVQFLNRLVKDLTIDTAYYNLRYEESQSVVNGHNAVIRLMYQTQESEEDVRELYSQIKWASEDLTTQNSAYSELNNSGNLNIFKNQELKNSIISYYRECEKTAKIIAEWDEVSTRHLIHIGQIAPNNIKFSPRFKDTWNGLPLYKEDWDYFNDHSSVKFKTLTFALSIYQLKHSDYLVEYDNLKNRSRQLIGDILQELASRN